MLTLSALHILIQLVLKYPFVGEETAQKRNLPEITQPMD